MITAIPSRVFGNIHSTNNHCHEYWLAVSNDDSSKLQSIVPGYSGYNSYEVVATVASSLCPLSGIHSIHKYRLLEVPTKGSSQLIHKYT